MAEKISTRQAYGDALVELGKKNPDIVVMDAEARPLILVECKATDIDFANRKTLSEVFEQATRYNAVVGARYLILSNGLQHFCFERSTEGYTPLRAFPRVG